MYLQEDRVMGTVEKGGFAEVIIDEWLVASV